MQVIGNIMEKKYKRIVFCDFDGTITTEDAFVNVCMHFAPKESENFLKGIHEGSLTLREGVRMIVEAIPSLQYSDMLDYVNSSKIRPGLDELLDYLEKEDVPFVVISGGLTGLVERQLGDIKKRPKSVYAADVQTYDEYLKLISAFEDGSELVNKKKVMAQYNYDQAVSIGDGITDRNMAEASSIVFARDQLAEYLNQNHTPYYPWNDFHDIKNVLEKLWK